MSDLIERYLQGLKAAYEEAAYIGEFLETGGSSARIGISGKEVQ
jgi:hypothetical protein